MTDDFDIDEFASDFLAVDPVRIPDDLSVLQDALISEAIRLAVSNLGESEKNWPRIHINSLRHWVERKLNPIVEAIDVDLETEEDWFLDILRESRGPTLTFLGDIIELAGGYYASAPTRVVKSGNSTAILISGLPTSAFATTPLEVKVAGVTRIVDSVDTINFEELGIPVQSRDSYIGSGEEETFDKEFALNLIKGQPDQPWSPRKGWKSYKGRNGQFGFTWGDEPKQVFIHNGQMRLCSLWKNEGEFGDREYWLKVRQENRDTKERMISIPRRLYKQICLLIDDLSGRPRTVEFQQKSGRIKVSCDFKPPAAQVRWLHATGARYSGFEKGQIHWTIDPVFYESTVEIFDKLSIDVKSDDNG